MWSTIQIIVITLLSSITILDHGAPGVAVRLRRSIRTALRTAGVLELASLALAHGLGAAVVSLAITAVLARAARRTGDEWVATLRTAMRRRTGMRVHARQR